MLHFPCHGLVVVVALGVVDRVPLVVGLGVGHRVSRVVGDRVPLVVTLRVVFGHLHLFKEKTLGVTLAQVQNTDIRRCVGVTKMNNKRSEVRTDNLGLGVVDQWTSGRDITVVPLFHDVVFHVGPYPLSRHLCLCLRE